MSGRAPTRDGLAITFPPDGAVLDLGIQGVSGGDGGTAGKVVLRLSQSRPPFYLFSNGHFIVASAHRRSIPWKPDGIGFATI
ncbi:hypothetical protein [Breoghania sp.]|uniref:hypothetical protein n=1 Tax=Breoghania sp. TaxID=2065378 RepID=UPI0026199D73|nr:hypothetical protein [Breoghania sp.]MDJ0932251.1 hypothetical protein [Breoghania sp.]